jgi:hypothetical protein
MRETEALPRVASTGTYTEIIIIIIMYSTV